MKTQGYTLIELLIYIGIFAFLSVVIVQSLLLISSSFLSVRTERNMTQGASTLLDRLTREIRFAENVDTLNSSFGVPSGQLTLRTGDAPYTTIEFALENERIVLYEGGISSGFLTPPHLVVQSFLLHLVSVHDLQAITFELTMYDDRTRNPAPRSFYGTALLRGSYE